MLKEKLTRENGSKQLNKFSLRLYIAWHLLAFVMLTKLAKIKFLPNSNFSQTQIFFISSLLLPAPKPPLPSGLHRIRTETFWKKPALLQVNATTKKPWPLHTQRCRHWKMKPYWPSLPMRRTRCPLPSHQAPLHAKINSKRIISLNVKHKTNNLRKKT